MLLEQKYIQSTEFKNMSLFLKHFRIINLYLTYKYESGLLDSKEA